MVEKMQNYSVKDIKLSKEGNNLIHWAEDHMPVLMRIKKEFEKRDNDHLLRNNRD